MHRVRLRIGNSDPFVGIQSGGTKDRVADVYKLIALCSRFIQSSPLYILTIIVLSKAFFSAAIKHNWLSHTDHIQVKGGAYSKVVPARLVPVLPSPESVGGHSGKRVQFCSKVHETCTFCVGQQDPIVRKYLLPLPYVSKPMWLPVVRTAERRPGTRTGSAVSRNKLSMFEAEAIAINQATKSN